MIEATDRLSNLISFFEGDSVPVRVFAFCGVSTFVAEVALRDESGDFLGETCFRISVLSVSFSLISLFNSSILDCIIYGGF